MKTICKLKLADLNKSNIEKREMSRLYGGNYCAGDYYNHVANNNTGKCSCLCESKDYYDDLNTSDFMKYTTAFAQDPSCD